MNKASFDPVFDHIHFIYIDFIILITRSKLVVLQAPINRCMFKGQSQAGHRGDLRPQISVWKHLLCSTLTTGRVAEQTRLKRIIGSFISELTDDSC